MKQTPTIKLSLNKHMHTENFGNCFNTKIMLLVVPNLPNNPSAGVAFQGFLITCSKCM